MTRRDLLGIPLGLLVMAGVVVGYFYIHAPEATKIKIGQTAPDLSLPSIGGGDLVHLSDLRGRPVLLVFFKTDCPKCQQALPFIERLNRRFLSRGLTVVGVTVDQDPQATQAYLKKNLMTFIVLQDPNGPAIRAAFGSYKMPETYLLDAAGTVRAVFLGEANWLGPPVLEQIEPLLPAPRSTTRSGR